MRMDWEVIEFSQTKLRIQANFEKPLEISFEEPNQIVIIFADPDLWISPVGIQMEPENRKLRRHLMRQLPRDAEGT